MESAKYPSEHSSLVQSIQGYIQEMPTNNEPYVLVPVSLLKRLSRALNQVEAAHVITPHEIWLRKAASRLSKTEYLIINYLFTAKRPVNRKELRRAFNISTDRSLWTRLAVIRKKMDLAGLGEVGNICGVGYYLVVPELNINYEYYAVKVETPTGAV